MGKIEILDDNMINMIAAGEVIERPASVVKELMENSIDAGAQKITVTIEDGGKKGITVTDDGCGMDAEDLLKAFEPHATSKIRTSHDLLGITSMGFRGEALASIASISQVQITSRIRNSLEAHTLSIDCGTKGPIKPCSGDCGTTLEIRNLFYKLPARRKFLRTANTEMSHISETFTRIALAYPALDLTLIHNTRTLHRLYRGQSLKERIAALLTAGIAEDLIETSIDDKGIRIRALIGKPSAGKTSSKYQYIFLNGRFIRDKFILHAIKEAYRGLTDPNRFPVIFLFINMDPSDFDVNVHPTKIEVRFDNSNLVHSQVLAAIREKLLGTNLDVEGKLPQPQDPFFSQNAAREELERKERIRSAMNDFFKDHQTSTQNQSQFSFTSPSSDSSHRTSMPIPSGKGSSFLQPNQLIHFMQIHDSYIVLQTEEGFEIIDQHALHERILYEKLKEKIQSGKLPSQKLLIPETFEITPIQAQAINKHTSLLSQLGIDLVPFGPNTLAIQAFPVILKKVNPTEFVHDLLDILTDSKTEPDIEELIHTILDMAACKAAVKAGQKLTTPEIQNLIEQKDISDLSCRCPHGRPTTIKFSIHELEKQFKRT